MTAQIIIRIRPDAPEKLEWLNLDDDGLIHSQGMTTTNDLPTFTENWQGKSITLLVPGNLCSSILENIPAKSQRQIKAALPYAAEDSFAEDIDELHFAIGSRSINGDVAALVVNKLQMSQWLQNFDDANIIPKLVTAEHQALPKPVDAAVLLLRENNSLLRLQDGRSFTIENSMLPIMLKQFSTTTESEENESDENHLDKLLVLGPQAHQESELFQQLSESISNHWNILFEGQPQAESEHSLNADLLYLAQNLESSTPINLLQASFKRRSPTSKNWLMWKWPAIAVAAIFTLMLTTWSIDYFSLKKQLTNLKSAHTEVYKKAFPSAKTIVRPVAQMRGKLKSQGAVTQQGLFFPLLKKLSLALGKVNETEITNINFRAKKAVLKVDFLAPDFNAIQTLQDELKAQQLIVTPGASNASGNKYFGRLTIKEKE